MESCLRDRFAMIAGGARDDSPASLLRRETGELKERSPDLEGAGSLQAFELEPDGNSKKRGQLRRLFERSREDSAAEKLLGFLNERKGEPVYRFLPAGFAAGADGGRGSG
jgi:hypothetical protein